MAYTDLVREPGDEALVGTQQGDARIHRQSINPDYGPGEEDQSPATDNSSAGTGNPGQHPEVDLSTRIRAARRRAHLSQEELAKRLSLRQSSISQWEIGKSQPDLDNRIRLAEILKIPLPDLLPEAGTGTQVNLTDPIILATIERFARLPPPWQATISLLISHLLETLEKPR